MNNLQRAGSMAAGALGVLFIIYLVLLMFVLPARGVGPGTLNDPANGLAFVATSSLPVLIDLLYVGIAAAFLLITLALYERLRMAAPGMMQVSAAAGVSASVLFLCYGMSNFVGNPVAVHLYAHDPTLASTLYLSLRTVANGLNAAALFAAGWSILLAGWVAQMSGRLARGLGYGLMAAGIAQILSFLLLPIGLLGVLLTPVWSIGLGVALGADYPSQPGKAHSLRSLI